MNPNDLRKQTQDKAGMDSNSQILSMQEENNWKSFLGVRFSFYHFN